MRIAGVLAGLWLAAALSACGPAAVTEARIAAADREPGSWMTHGRTYAEQRFSPLDDIDTENVSELGRAWSYELREPRGAEATPIMVDGVMYVTSAWSIVYALDAATGRELWVYDPEVPREWSAQRKSPGPKPGAKVNLGRKRPIGRERRRETPQRDERSLQCSTLQVDRAVTIL